MVLVSGRNIVLASINNTELNYFSSRIYVYEILPVKEKRDQKILEFTMDNHHAPLALPQKTKSWLTFHLKRPITLPYSVSPRAISMPSDA